MAESKASDNGKELSRDRLAELLNEDLSREYQAIIGYVVYSQVLKGAEFMNIADQLAIHAKQELDHAIPWVPQGDRVWFKPLRFDLANENETIRNYRERVGQCEALGEFALAEQIRQILVDEQDHQIDLATALGEEVPDVGRRAHSKRR